MHHTSRYLLGASGVALLASPILISWHRTRVSRGQLAEESSRPEPVRMAQSSIPFRTLFAVPMTCDGCVKDISDTLYKVKGISKVEAQLKEQLVTVEGTAPPSAIVDAIQGTGRDAILRGSGTSNSAAVSILETFHRPEVDNSTATAAARGSDGQWVDERLVRGLARMVQVSPKVTLVDLTLKGLTAGTYFASIREYGDLKDGAASTGPVWSGGGAGGPAKSPRGSLGTITVGPNGRGSAFIDRPFEVWEVVGHALVVSQHDEGQGRAAIANDENTVVGVIARSAGMWDNDKTVCSCTGKTLWEERKDVLKNGVP